MADGETSTKMIATLAGFLGTALGVLITYFTALTDLAVLEERSIALDNTISSGMTDRYRGSDARRDFALVNQQINQNAHQIEELQKMLRDHVESDKKHRQ